MTTSHIEKTELSSKICVGKVYLHSSPEGALVLLICICLG